MKPAPFNYVSPQSLTAALDVLAENSFEAKVLAGGQSLIPAMNFRLTAPSMLIDLNGLTELDYIRSEGDQRIRIGAMTRQRALEKSRLIREKLPLLSETMPFIAHAQIRNRGTIGGSLAHADPASELPVILVALDGRLHLQSKTNQRWVNAKDFFLGIFTTDLAMDEMITEVEIPAMPGGRGWSFQEFSRRKGDYALMGVAVVFSVDAQGACRDGRLVYLNAGDAPANAVSATEMMEGQRPSSALFDDVARTAAYEVIKPVANIHASVPYLRHLAYVLTLRGLDKALERAASVGE